MDAPQWRQRCGRETKPHGQSTTQQMASSFSLILFGQSQEALLNPTD
jgi:hypothetical protein